MRSCVFVCLLFAWAACGAEPETPPAVDPPQPEVPVPQPQQNPTPQPAQTEPAATPAPDDDSPAGMRARAEAALRAYWDGLDKNALMTAAMQTEVGRSALQSLASTGPEQDSWGNALRVRIERGEQASSIYALSPGPDGVFGTVDDLRWPRATGQG